MLRRSHRTIGIAAAIIVGIWVVAWVGHTVARNSRMTADKFRSYVQSVDFAPLKGQERAEALRTLAAKLNALPPDERRRVRLNRDWEAWFEQMTEAEKQTFIEATFPAGVKQMIATFENMSEDRRRRMLDEALRRLREEREAMLASEDGRLSEARGEPSPLISPELEARIRTLGLRTFIAESSAQTKAEVAPLLEEIQRIVESGGRIRGRRR